MAFPKFNFTAEQIINEGRTSQRFINELIKWMPSQKKIPVLSNEQMVMFLLSCKNDVHQTKHTIRTFYSIRKSNPHLFNDRNPIKGNAAQALSTMEVCSTFRKRTNQGIAVIVSRLRDSSYKNFDLAAIIKAYFMVIDTMITDHPPNGFIVIYDMNSLGFRHLLQFTPGLLKPFFFYLQEGIPTRLEAIHILKSNAVLTALLKIITPFLNKNLLNKLHLHPPSMEMNYFHQNYVPKSVLPKDYGGVLPSITELADITLEKMIQMKEHFEAEELQRTSVK